MENQSSRKMVCYACNQPRHLVMDCPEKANKEKPISQEGVGRKVRHHLGQTLSPRGDIVTIKGS